MHIQPLALRYVFNKYKYKGPRISARNALKKFNSGHADFRWVGLLGVYVIWSGCRLATPYHRRTQDPVCFFFFPREQSFLFLYPPWVYTKDKFPNPFSRKTETWLRL